MYASVKSTDSRLSFLQLMVWVCALGQPVRQALAYEESVCHPKIEREKMYGFIVIQFYTVSPGKSCVGKVVRYSCSRSFKVIEISTNRKTSRDFLLVFHCKYVPIFYRF